MAKVDYMKSSMDFFPSAALRPTLNDPVTSAPLKQVITWHL